MESVRIQRPMRLVAWLVGLVLVAAVVPLLAVDDAPVVVRSRVEPQSVGVGTPFRYFIRVESREEAEIILPLLVDQIGPFLIRDYGTVQPQQEDGATVHEQWYDLVGYEVGHQLVPGPVVAYRIAGGGLEEIAVPETVVTVESLLPAVEQMAGIDIRDVRAPLGVPRATNPIWWVVAAVAAVVAALIAVAVWWSRGGAQQVVPIRPAHEVALEQLRRLRTAKLLEEGRQPEYYVRLSGIVRSYVEHRFGVRAPEMTTEEFLLVAQSSRDLPTEHRSQLSGFLGEADLVKFARHVPTVEQGERAFDAAREFVSKTREQPEANDAAA